MDSELTRRLFIAGATLAAAGIPAAAFSGSANMFGDPRVAPERLMNDGHLICSSEITNFLDAVTRGDLAAVQKLVTDDASLIYSRESQDQSAYLLAASTPCKRALLLWVCRT